MFMVRQFSERERLLVCWMMDILAAVCGDGEYKRQVWR